MALPAKSNLLGFYWDLAIIRLKAPPRRSGYASNYNEEKGGGRGWDRTSDPYDVNVVLSR